jgi:glycosyltransferase involved in cell wall biosynthesis
LNAQPPPIRVLYDHQVFTWQNFGGISRYYADLLSVLHTSAAFEPQLSLAYSDNAHIAESAPWKDAIQPKSACKLPLSVRFFRKSRARYSPAAINRKRSIATLQLGEHDLVHPTYYDPYFLEHLGGKPFVITVYDMIHELFPEHYLDDPTVREKEQVIRRADHILAISHSTKKDLVEIYGIAPEKISVTHLGTAFSPATCPPAALQLPEKFLLHVGHRGGYKNAYFMLRALREILRATPALHIVFAGGGPFTKNELQFIDILGLAGRVHYHEASTPSLVTLYQRALVLLCPSLYEGFGLPVTEAFNCGCPVLSSRTPALAEVAGDAALYFDAKNIVSIQETVAHALNDRDALPALRAKAALRAKEFSPLKCARETAAVYSRLLGRTPAMF